MQTTPPLSLADIQRVVDRQRLALSEKGKREAVVEIHINADAPINGYYRWTKGESYDWVSHHVNDASVAGVLAKMESQIAALPGAKETAFTEFMNVLAKAVDVGRKNGIDVNFVNPLEKLMKDLSKNALASPKEIA